VRPRLKLMESSSSLLVESPLLVPPLNFAQVTPGIYRSGSVASRNFPFLERLQLRTVLHVHPNPPLALTAAWCAERGIRLLHVPLVQDEWKAVPSEQIAPALRTLLEPANLPALVHCTKGKHRTGVLMGCLRKAGRWSLTSIFDEYRRHAGNKAREADELSVERFQLELLT